MVENFIHPVDGARSEGDERRAKKLIVSAVGFISDSFSSSSGNKIPIDNEVRASSSAQGLEEEYFRMVVVDGWKSGLWDKSIDSVRYSIMICGLSTGNGRNFTGAVEETKRREGNVETLDCGDCR